jgi:hypothetical protein
MSGQIFLYSSGGRTLWVPRHTPTANETKPVCMLNFVTPLELSRSFYLFDYPVQVVESAQMAAMNPNAKTPNEVLAAVNDFRRLCAEDQTFLLQRCYNPQQSPQPQQQQQPQPQQHNYQGNYPQSMPSSSVGNTQSAYGGNSASSTTYEANKPAGGTIDNAALLTQLLQQQRQQQQQQPQQPQRMSMMGNGSGSYPDLTTGNNAYGGSYGDDSGNGGYYNNGRGRGGRRAGMYNTPFTPDMMQQQQPMNPMMMGGGYGGGNAGYGMDPMMMYNNSGMPYQRGRNGRRDGQMYGNYGNPMMMMPQQPMMMMGGGPGGGGRRGAAGGGMSAMPGQARMAPGARHEPEPITIDVAVPEDIKNVYMNPAQQLVIATMPGPHMTVWLREHPIPTDTQDKKYVFGKNGVILMLKAAFEEVKDSKPVELFPKQICTHFFIYGYCSRANCFHEHHSEQQLRELIAARHVQLKAMTKAQRHELIAEIEEKDKAGVAAAEAQRAEREKRRAEAMAEREARRQQRQQARDPQYQQQQSQSQQQQPSSYSMPSSQPNPSQDIGSDNEDDTTTLGGQGSQSLADLMASSPSQDFAVNATTATENSGVAEDTSAPATAALAKLGITDSDDDDDDDDAVSSSKSSGSAASEEGEKAEAEAVATADEAAPVEPTAANPPHGEAATSEVNAPHDNMGDVADADEKREDKEGEGEDEEEGDEGGEESNDGAKKGKKRGRAPAPKKAAKRAKK